MYVCVYIYIYIDLCSIHHSATYGHIREKGGAPRNPAPRNHFLAWIVKSSGCHCTDASDHAPEVQSPAEANVTINNNMYMYKHIYIYI